MVNVGEGRMVKKEIEKIAPNQRQVIELAYFEVLSQTEMPERMCQPLGTVKTWVFFFSSRRRHTIWTGDWSSDVCSSDLSIVPSQTSFGPVRRLHNRSASRRSESRSRR